MALEACVANFCARFLDLNSEAEERLPLVEGADLDCEFFPLGLLLVDLELACLDEALLDLLSSCGACLED